MTSPLALAIHKFPTVALMTEPTPVARLSRLEEACGAKARNIRLFIKRDDTGEVGGGGNKLRKLEFLLGQALAEGVETVVTVGGIQSNHARLTAAATAKLGLSCELLLADMVPKQDTEYREGGNVLLDRIFGASLTFLSAGADVVGAANARREELEKDGRRAVFIPAGGSSKLGALGYAKCAQEILDFEAENDVEFSAIVVPNGSHGTQAGLVAGLELDARRGKIVRGYSVLADRDITHEKTVRLAREALDLLGGSGDALDEHLHVVVNGDYRGDAYGVPTRSMIEAVHMLARTEGILLDPVYSGKAFAGLLGDIAQDRFEAGTDLLFVATGGVPGLFAYRDTFD